MSMFRILNLNLIRQLPALLCALFLISSCGSSHAATTAVRPDGVILKDGTPFYPFGFYFDGYNIAKDIRLADLATMADGGFNVIATNIDNVDGPLFDLAASRGVGVFMEFNDPNDTILQQVQRWKDHPALFAWQIADDVDNGRKTPESVRAAHDSIKTVDNTHITYASAGHPNPGTGHDWVGNYMNVSDTLAMQSYPIPGEQLSAANSTLKTFHSAAPPGKALFANTQAFQWEGKRAPTPDEVRNMTYVAYINGMKGIIFYTFRTDYWNLQENAALWAQMRALAQENAIMRPWLLNGQMTRQVDTGAQRYNVFCSYWTYNGKLYIMFANVSGNNRNTSVVLPEGTTGPAVPLFPGTPSGMTFNNATRTISGTVQSRKVHVYELNHIRANINDWALY